MTGLYSTETVLCCVVSGLCSTGTGLCCKVAGYGLQGLGNVVKWLSDVVH